MSILKAVLELHDELFSYAVRYLGLAGFVWWTAWLWLYGGIFAWMLYLGIWGFFIKWLWFTPLPPEEIDPETYKETKEDIEIERYAQGLRERGYRVDIDELNRKWRNLTKVLDDLLKVFYDSLIESSDGEFEYV